MTTPYSPGTARAITCGASEEGWTLYSGVPWDPEVSRWNLRVSEQRTALRAVNARETAADLRRRLRAAADVTAAPLTVLAVGDSLTAGATSADGTGYRGYLADLLDRRDYTATITSAAVGGYTLRQIAPQAVTAAGQQQPDLVLIHIGINDAAQPDLGDWQGRLGTCVDQILAAAPDCKVAVARVQVPYPTWIGDSVTGTINPGVDAVVAARQASGRVAAADMTGWGQDHTSDGVHPLDAGYLHMARVWDAALAAAGWL
jgi:lysophospholipase L1-like esterase